MSNAGSGKAVAANNQRLSLSFFLRNAPLSMSAAILPGLANYGIIVFLTYDLGFADAGRYRLLLSIYGLIGLVALPETQKIFVRSIITDGGSALPALWINRALFSALPFLLIAVFFLVRLSLGYTSDPSSYLWIAALSALIYTTDLYIGFLQAHQRFGLLFSVELAKYIAAVTAFSVAIHSGYPVDTAVAAMLASLALMNIIYTVAITKGLSGLTKSKTTISQLLCSDPARRARTYSFANMLPASMEHIDKLLIGWVFGLQWLGIYTLAFSTGRLAYNGIKPAFYIYYRRFVDRMPSGALLWKLGLIATLVGGFLTAAFLLALNQWPAMRKFETGAVVTVIIFSSYGIAIVRAVYMQAFTLNRHSVASHAWHASFKSCLIAVPLLVIALLSKPAVALIFFAMQYPVRDLVAIGYLTKYKRLSA